MSQPQHDPTTPTPAPAQPNPVKTDSRSVPKGLIISLVIANLLLGLAELKAGSAWENWLQVFWQWALLLVLIPLGITLMAVPLKLRDNKFVLKHAFYMGLFVACVYAINALRYLR